MGPKGWIQDCVMLVTRVTASLLSITHATVHRIASSIRWEIMTFLWNRMSHCTISLKAVARRVVVADFGLGLVHILQILQVSTTSLAAVITEGGAPACSKSCSMRLAAACQNRTCRRRSVLRTTAGSRLCKRVMARPMSNWPHSANSGDA
jgi:hypothetical protein